MITKTRQQIAIEYGISSRTLQRWIDKKDIKLSAGLINPKEQEIIYETFGNPKIEEKEVNS